MPVLQPAAPWADACGFVESMLCDGAVDAVVFTIDRVNLGPTVLLSLSGTADDPQPARLADALAGLLDDPPAGGVVVDATGVDFMSTPSLATLMDFCGAARYEKVACVVVASRPVARPLRMIGADVELRRNVGEALAYCDAQAAMRV